MHSNTDHDWTLSQTRSDEVTIVSRNLFLILFSHTLQGLGRSSPSSEISKPQFYTHFFLWPAYKKPHFYSFSQKKYKVKGTEFLKLSIFTFLRCHVTLSLLCPNIFHSYLLSNTLNQSHCHHMVGAAVSFGFGETSLPSTYGVESSGTNVPNYSVRFQQILHCHCR
jgi:hypothetical protein